MFAAPAIAALIGTLLGFTVAAAILVPKLRVARSAAEHDPLTGLPNRVLAAKTVAGQGARFWMCMLDLDDFGLLNKKHGHDVGDYVLITAANRMRAYCEESGGLACRLGGDEFALLVPKDSHDDGDIRAFAKEVLHTIAEPVDVGERTLLSVTGSLGIGTARTWREGLGRAEVAMWPHKRREIDEPAIYALDVHGLVARAPGRTAVRRRDTNMKTTTGRGKPAPFQQTEIER
ncbi:GGDEF domain-containing protein [Fodinicola feengrottensis]|uniref:GGDEF domain-containing protein n=1 Tax=Fodinicola feengrottensis TaxID=435914 RepID=A0ABN2GMM4_9ACTN|nr:GGDEF domain-containing protein [Fodinicola feengrottensis]